MPASSISIPTVYGVCSQESVPRNNIRIKTIGYSLPYCRCREHKQQCRNETSANS